MQEGRHSLAELRELAAKCRKLAQIADERGSTALRTLADEYDEAIRQNQEVDRAARPIPIAISSKPQP